MKPMMYLRNTAITLLTTSCLLACASTVEEKPPVVVPGPVDLSAPVKTAQETQPLSPEERARVNAVSERSKIRLAALLKRDYAQAYQFSTPGWRALHDVERFRGANEGVRTWQSAEVRSAQCPAPDRCEVRVRIDARVFAGGAGLRGSNLTTHFSEVWLFQDGEWWYVQNK
ncbi:MAG: hypothetical protein Q8S02_08050 [Hydrogenophaga sp.]|nr:hypothetical protein [Hydrogenophaga sp.]